MCTSSSGPYLSSKTRPRRRPTWTSDWSSSKAKCMSPYCLLAITCYSHRSLGYSLRVENQIKDITEKSEKRRAEVRWSHASRYIKIKGAVILQKDRGDSNSPPGINAKARSATYSCKGVIIAVLRILNPWISVVYPFMCLSVKGAAGAGDTLKVHAVQLYAASHSHSFPYPHLCPDYRRCIDSIVPDTLYHEVCLRAASARLAILPFASANILAPDARASASN